MSTIGRDAVAGMMKEILARQGKPGSLEESSNLRDVGFRSLDFSELALKVEMQAGRPLQFEGTDLRGIETVKDVLDFLEKASGANA